MHDRAARIDHIEPERQAVEFPLPVPLLDDETDFRFVAGTIDSAVGEDKGGQIMRGELKARS